MCNFCLADYLLNAIRVTLAVSFVQLFTMEAVLEELKSIRPVHYVFRTYVMENLDLNIP